MNCNECKDDLGAYLDGELATAQAERVLQHTQACAVCGEELQALRKLAVGIAASRPEPVPSQFLQQVRAKIVGEAKPRPSVDSAWRAWWREVWAPRWNWPKLPAMAGALAMLLITGMLVMTQLGSRRSGRLAFGERIVMMYPPVAASAPRPAANPEAPASKKDGERFQEEIALAKPAPAPALAVGPAESDKAEKNANQPLAAAPRTPSTSKQGNADALREDRSLAGASVDLKRNREISVTPETVQQCTLTTEDIRAANGAAKIIVARLGGKLVEEKNNDSGTDLALMTVQIPTTKVTAFMSELGKQGVIATPTGTPVSVTVARESGGRSETARPSDLRAAPAKPVGAADRRLSNADQIASSALPPPTAPAGLKQKDLETKESAPGSAAKLGSNQLQLDAVSPEFTTLQIHFQQSEVAKKQQYQKPQKLPPQNPGNPAAGQKKG